MGRDDIDFAIWLIDQEGWGYTHVELERMLKLDPEGSFIYEDKRPLGIVTCVSYGKTGVVGHLVVSKEGRGRKVGQSLVTAAVEYLEGVGVESMLLYATPEGTGIYERFGFRTSRNVLCMNVHASPGPEPLPGCSCELIRPEDLADVISIDRELFGDDRSRILEMLHREFPEHCFKLVRNGRIASFAFGRKTPVGFDLGPWVGPSDNRAEAEAPLRAFFDAVGPNGVFLGVFSDNPVALSICETLVKNRVWNTALMVRGKGRYEKDIRRIFGVAAFELG